MSFCNDFNRAGTFRHNISIFINKKIYYPFLKILSVTMQNTTYRHAKKYLKHKDTYKAYTKLKKNKQDTFYNEHTAELILFESAKKYLKEHLGESKTLNISKWKSEIGTLRKEKDNLYSQIVDVRKEVEQAEKVKICIEQLQEQEKKLSQVKRNELDL